MSDTKGFNPRISNLLAVVLITIAIFVDITQALLSVIGFLILGVALNTLISACMTMFFGIVFIMNGVSFFSSRRLAVTGTALLIEAIPLLNNLPTWTMYTVVAVKNVRKEDKERWLEKNSSAYKKGSFTQ
ncbi:MAG: hypothetical protein WD509_01255 [Candidatus Paceibacterota bacterium]